MRAKDRFLMALYRRSGGRIDRTFHAYLHIAKPLALSEREARHHLDLLLDKGLIEADPGFDRLIRLTPAGVGACACAGTADVAVREVCPEMALAPLCVLSAPAGVGSAEASMAGYTG